MTDPDPDPSIGTVVALFCCLVVIVITLLFLYKKLNKETNGEYTVQRIVYKEGGVRDQVRRVALALETRLGVQLWPRGDADDVGEEMQDFRDVEAEGGSRSDGEGDEESEEEEEDSNSSGREGSDDGSGVEEEEEQAKLIEEPKEHQVKIEAAEGKQEDKGEGKSLGTGLLIDLNQFSGSAIWSGEQGGLNEDASDIATVL
ncbi:unnamed protein product [Ophioblennius macclurei]